MKYGDPHLALFNTPEIVGTVIHGYIIVGGQLKQISRSFPAFLCLSLNSVFSAMSTTPSQNHLCSFPNNMLRGSPAYELVGFSLHSRCSHAALPSPFFYPRLTFNLFHKYFTDKYLFCYLFNIFAIIVLICPRYPPHLYRFQLQQLCL